jgi:hypothetical protein
VTADFSSQYAPPRWLSGNDEPSSAYVQQVVPALAVDDLLMSFLDCIQANLIE